MLKPIVTRGCIGALTALALTLGLSSASKAATLEELGHDCDRAFTVDTLSAYYTCLGDLKSIPIALGSLGPSSASGWGVGLRKSWDVASGSVSGSGLVAADGSYVIDANFLKVMLDPEGGLEDRAWSIFANRSELQRVPYYGLGPSSLRADLAYYRETTNLVGAFYSVPHDRWLNVSLQARYVDREIGRTASSVPAVVDRFAPATTPGLVTQPGFVNLRLIASAHTANEEERESCRFTFSRSALNSANACLTYDYYIDTRGSDFSFHRAELFATVSYDLRGDAPLKSTWFENLACQNVGSRECSIARLVVNALVTASFTGARQQVPFYFDKTLGGPDIDNVDTLRGFDTFRFRGPNRELVQAELYKGLWGPLGLYAFFDAGKVTTRTGDLGFDHLRHDVGTGIYLGLGSSVFFRAYVAGGGGEGTHVNARLAAAF